MVLLAGKRVPFASYFYFVLTVRAIKLATFRLYNNNMTILRYDNEVRIMIIHVTVNFKSYAGRIAMPENHIVKIGDLVNDLLFEFVHIAILNLIQAFRIYRL